MEPVQQAIDDLQALYKPDNDGHVWMPYLQQYYGKKRELCWRCKCQRFHNSEGRILGYKTHWYQWGLAPKPPSPCVKLAVSNCPN